MAKIIYTHTDEAPLLATYSFLPIIAGVRRQAAGVDVETRDISLAGRDHRAVPRPAHRRAAPRRRARRARRAGHAARGQHHQAAQHLRLDPAAQGGHHRAAGAGLRPARLPREPADRRGARDPRPLRQGQGLRGQPGAARGQLRPPRARLGQELRRSAPALAWAPGARESKTNVATMGNDDFRSNEKSVVLAADDTLASSTSAADGTETVLKEGLTVLAGEVVDATFMNVAALRRVPHRADRPGQGRGRAVLRAPQGHDDEGLRPDHLRPRRAAPSSRRSSSSTASSSPPPASRPTTASARSCRAVDDAARGRRDQGRGRAGPRRRARARDGRLRPAASPTCTSPPTSSSTPRCRR